MRSDMVETAMSEVVDVAFVLAGGTIPADHGWRLYRLLAERLAWLEADAIAGVHPIRGARSGSGAAELYVGGRGRLMLRLPRERAGDACALSGAHLDLGEGVQVGAAQTRTLFAHGTLYSHFVTVAGVGWGDEALFQRGVDEELRETGIECKVVCGKARRARGGSGNAEGETETLGFSLMLHGLSPEHSLKVQETGLGVGRKLGCGLFVPHRSAAAVGA